MRLDKAVSLAGLSRSRAAQAINAGRVKLNGFTALDAGSRVAAGDVVLLDDKPIDLSPHRHIMLNKPAGVITATRDEGGAETVMDLIPEALRFKGLGPVGRLDKDVTGLVILTSDGELAHRLISPKRDIEKLYEAVVEGRVEQIHAETFMRGMDLGEFIAKPAKLEIVSASQSESVCRVTVTEGKFHEVKRLFLAIGHPVIRLKRLSIASLALDERLKEGECRALTSMEQAILYEKAGLNRQ